MAVKATGLTRTFTQGNQEWIAADSLAAEAGVLVTYAPATGLAAAAAGETIAGVAISDKTYSATNFDTESLRCLIVPSDDVLEVTLPISGGTITVADEGNYFDLGASAVDGVSESATTGQVRMLKFISATEGVFEIANA